MEAGEGMRHVVEFLAKSAIIPAAILVTKILTAAPPARALMIPIFLYAHMLRTRGDMMDRNGGKNVTYAAAFVESIKMFGDEFKEAATNIVEELKNIDDNQDGKVDAREVLDAVGNIFKSGLPGVGPDDRMMGPVLDLITTNIAWEAAGTAGQAITETIKSDGKLAQAVLQMVAAIPVSMLAIVAGTPAKPGEKPRDERAVAGVLMAIKGFFGGGSNDGSGPGDSGSDPVSRFASGLDNAAKGLGPKGGALRVASTVSPTTRSGMLPGQFGGGA